MTSLTFEILGKGEITAAKANHFIALLKEQRKVRPPSVARVRQCQKLIFVMWNGAAIGIGAIKPKTLSDFRPDKADLPKLKENIAYELGYFYVKDTHRGLGISSTLARLLLRDYQDCNLIASTELHANNPMISVLHKNGFQRMGKSWKSNIHCGDLGLFVKLIPPAINLEKPTITTIADYTKTAEKIGFVEYPYYITGMEPGIVCGLFSG